MHIRHKIAIDRYFGIPLAFLLNILTQLIGFLLRIDHSLDKDFKKIAVCKFVGMGSIIQCTPLLQTLRKKYPNSTIIFITTDTHIPLLEKTGLVDEIVSISDKNLLSLIISVPKMIFQLWSLRIGLYLDLEIYSNISSIICTLSCAKNRIGFYKQSKHYRLGIYTHMMFFNMKAPISMIYLQLARIVGCKEILTSLHSMQPAQEDIQDLLKKLAITEEYVVINPNASELRVERKWPNLQFSELINRISTDYPQVKIVLIGAKNESENVAKVIENVAEFNQIIDTSAKLNLNELIALISNAKLLITNDTGPMHLAFATNSPVIALFGPGSPDHYANVENCTIIYNNIYCSPCLYEFDMPPCNGDNQCMKVINVDQVYLEFQNLMKGIAHQRKSSMKEILYNGIHDKSVLGIVSRNN